MLRISCLIAAVGFGLGDEVAEDKAFAGLVGQGRQNDLCRVGQTEQDIQIVLDRNDLTLAELAEKLGRSSSAIRAMRHRLGYAAGRRDPKVQTLSAVAG